MSISSGSVTTASAKTLRDLPEMSPWIGNDREHEARASVLDELRLLLDDFEVVRPTVEEHLKRQGERVSFCLH